MKSIELTIRLRVPDDTTDEQLEQIGVVAAQAAVTDALELVGGTVVLVTPLQDVLVMNGHVG